MGSLFVFLLASSFICYNAVPLDKCVPRSWKSGIIDFIPLEWFRLGQVFSYCVQSPYNETLPVDKHCTSKRCEECIKVCLHPSPFNLTDCTTTCNGSSDCINGCRFYSHITHHTNDDGIIVDASNYPEDIESFDINQTVTNYSSTTFEWPTVFSESDSKPISSIYLLTLNTSNHGKFSSMGVLGLSSEVSYIMVENDLCATLRNKYDDGAMFNFNVFPINFNSYNQQNFASSDETTFKLLPAIRNLTVYSPMFSRSGTRAKVSWTVSWSLPVNASISYDDEVEIITKVTKCEDATSLNTLVLSGFMLVNRQDVAMNGNAVVHMFNTKSDALKDCFINVQVITRYSSCLVADHSHTFKFPASIRQHEYFCDFCEIVNVSLISSEGCDSVPNYDNAFCNPVTTPKPTNGPFRKREFNVSKPFCREFNSTCEYFVNVTFSWLPPMTPSPILSYQLYYGLVSYSVLFKQDVVNVIDSDKNVPENTTSYFISYVPAGKRLGVLVHPNTQTSENPRTFLPHSYAIEQMPIYVPPTTTKAPLTNSPMPVSNSPEGNNAGLIAGILVPLVLIIIALIVFILWRRNRSRHAPKWKSDIYTMENYMDFSEKEKLADEWEIYPEDITLDVKIGEGAFGTVYSAAINGLVISNTKYAQHQGGAMLLEANEDSSTKVAVKLLKEGANQDECADFREEIKLMKGIGYHKNIVNMIGCSTIKKPLCLVVEFMTCGDLLHFLRQRRMKLCTTQPDGDESATTGFMYTQNYQDSLQTTLSTDNSKSELIPNDVPLDENSVITPDDLLSFAWQIASGMEYLSSINLVHRDLAARNILIGSDKNVKISDFGLTRKVSDELIYMSNKNRRLPVKWMSVEAIFDQMFTSYSDVWAYGVVLFEIVTLGGTPYPSINNRELLGLLKSGYRMERPENCAEPMYDIMLHCWNEDPLQRPTFSELREHLEGIISQGDRYFSFEIDEENTYYNAASFKSVPSEEDDVAVDFMQKPMQVKTVEDLKKLSDDTPLDNAVEERYTSPQNLKMQSNLGRVNGMLNMGLEKSITSM